VRFPFVLAAHRTNAILGPAAEGAGYVRQTTPRRRRKTLSKQVISTPNAPAAIGPYSQAVRVGNLVFVSGQIPLDPATGQLVGGDIGVQTEQVLENLAAILEAAGSGLAQVVKATVYLRDLGEFGRMNEVYAKFFRENPPARATVQVARLPREAALEIDVVAEV
jgi:2-iminobutanoate/2-iminopropanoate deaminase